MNMFSTTSLKDGSEINKTYCTSETLYQALEEYDLLTILEAFNEAPGNSINARNLRELLSKKIHIEFEDDEYESIFNKIDVSSEGAVTWDEFISFLILGYEQSAISLEYKSLEPPIPGKPKMKQSIHRSNVIRIVFCPTLKPDREMSWALGSYMTLSKDGVINYWTLDMEYQKTVHSTNPDLKVTTTWVTDMAVMPDVSIIVTSSSERDLRFYDTSARKFELRVRFISLDYAVSTMYYYYPRSASEESKLIMGDMGGSVIVLHIETEERGPFKSALGRPLLQCPILLVKQGLQSGFRMTTFSAIHSDYVRQVYYYKSLRSVVSCANCPVSPFVITDLIDLTKKQDPKAYKVSTGIWCFDIVESLHMIATAGPDCLIRIWNAFMPTRPTATLYRHHTGIIHMTFQDNAKLLYSLSKDRNIKVWDMQTQQLTQNYIDLPLALGEKEMCTLYNPDSREWILGSAMVAILPLSPKQSSEHTDGNTHSSGVSCVLYNKLFKLIVTVGIDSYILVWNPWDGRNMLVIKEAHVMMLHGLPIPVEITSASFSQNYHFLITAAHDGSLKIWDFHNGTCLRNMRFAKPAEICQVFWIGNRVLATGWNRRITEFNSKGEAVGHGRHFSKNWDKRHTDDISSAAVRIPQTVVTASFNGEIVMWRLETGQPYKKYNVANPTVRIKIEYKMHKHSEIEDEGKQKTNKTNLLTRKSLQARRTSVLTSDKRRISVATPTVEIKRKISQVDLPDEILSLRRLAVHSMLFLNSRKMDANNGTLLISLENGYIQVWSHDVHGGYITSFSSIHKGGDYVITMCTDENNEFLFTGHSTGYVKTWLIKNYCTRDPEEISLPKYRLRFPFMWGFVVQGRASRINNGQPENPILLNSYKGHYLPISSLVYIDESEILVSGSADRSARMWTLGGRFIQTLGSFKGWKEIEKGKPLSKDFEFTVPADLKRLLSSTSLRVLSGGYLDRTLTQKQVTRRAAKERVGVDVTKVYGKALTAPILGNYYKLPIRSTTSIDVTFDTSFPYIPVYQHLIMPVPNEVILPERKITPLSEETAEKKDEKF